MNITNNDNQQRVMFVTLCVLFILFILLANIVMSGFTEGIDKQSILLFRSDSNLNNPIGPKWVEELMRDITALGGTGILVFFSLMVTCFLVLVKHKRMAITFALTVITGITLSSLLKYGFTRPRPDIVPHASYVYTSSFPSGHAFMSSLIYLSIANILGQFTVKRTLKYFFLIIAIILSLAIGISRIYLGVHYVTDVIGGWILGISWTLLSYFSFRYLK